MSSNQPAILRQSHSAMHQRFVRLILKLPGLMLPLINRTNGSMVSRGEKRSYLLFVPETYRPDHPTPLVISLHGFGQWPAHQMQITRWNDLARREGFIMVYPCGTQVPLRWRTDGKPGGNTDPLQDVTFISDLIEKLESEYNLDSRRIYVNGLSNGGGMSFLLSFTLSAKVAAIGSVAGAYPFWPADFRRARPVPAILFHGTQDPIVPYLGGLSGSSGYSFPSIPDWVASLASFIGCPEVPVRLPAVGAVNGFRFANCASDAEVVFYSIAGGGHTWPGGGYIPKFIAGHINRDIDATKMMWDFFRRHPLNYN